MAIGSGMAAQLSYGVESTAGTIVTPDIHLPMRGETLDDARTPVESEAIRAGRRLLDSSDWNGGAVTVSGGTSHDLTVGGEGTLLRALVGGTSSTTGSGPYTHVLTPGDLPSITIQKGVPGVAGTVYPVTFGGMKAATGQIACEQGAIGSLGLEWAGMNAHAGSRVVATGGTTSGSTTITVTGGSAADIFKPVTGTGIPVGAFVTGFVSSTSLTISAAATATGTPALTIGTPLATPTYPSSPKLWKWHHAGVAIGGSFVPIKSGTVSFDNGLDVERRFLASKTVASPMEANLRNYTGQFEAEFTDLTQYNRYLAGDMFAVIFGFSDGTNSLTFTMNARYEPGLTPVVGGTGIVPQSLPFKCIGTTDAAALTITVINSDATIA
jgi:uncharacterized protein (DUF779 family)